MFNLNNLIIAAGIIQLTILIASSLVPKVTNWKKNLSSSDPFFRSLVWSYGFFIFLIVLSFGLFSTFKPELLINGNDSGKYICGFISVFWLSRLIIQLLIFKTPDFLKTGLMKVGFNILTLAFMYLAIIYGLAVFV